MTKFNFAPLLKTVIEKTFTQASIQNDFKGCGLFRFDSEAVDYSKCNIMSSKPEEIPVTQIKSHIEGECCLNLLETLINPETVAQFQTTYKQFTPIWGGNVDAHDLYVVWKKMKDQCSSSMSDKNKCAPTSTPVTLRISCPNQKSVKLITSETENVLEILDDETFTTRPTTKLADGRNCRPTGTNLMNDDLNQPSCSRPDTSKSLTTQKSPERRDKLAKVLSPGTQGENVPSPLKDILLWPGTPQKNKS